LIDLNSERTQGVDRVHAILARKKTPQDASAVGKRGDDDRAMRDALIAGNCNLGVDTWGPFYAKFHGANEFVLVGAGGRVMR